MASGVFSRDETKATLRQAIEAAEGRTSAELMLAVRPCAAPYTHVDLLVGAVTSYGALLYVLFAPQVFGLGWIAAIVPGAFIVGVLLARALAPLRVALVGAETVNAALRDRARSLFVELGVSATRERSGILIFIALLERRCAVVADIGVTSQTPPEEWSAAVTKIEGALREPNPVAALAEAITAAGELLARHLPRATDDENELEDLSW